MQAHGLSASTAQSVAHTPPVSILFAAFLGYNPLEHLIGPHALASLSASNHAIVTGRTFFPQLISGPFRTGLHEAFLFAIVACLIAAAASLMRGGSYHHVDQAPEPSGLVKAPDPQAGELIAAASGDRERVANREEQYAR